jgi:predicted ATPase
VRAVRAGLGIIEAVEQLNCAMSEEHGISLAVRLGCHTGLVVVGDEVGGTGHDDMVLGDTPNIAARLQGAAEPNTLVVGALTHQLLDNLFACESMGAPPLKGVSAPLEVYRVLYESTARTRLEALASTGLTPLVGRDDELALLEGAWDRIIGGHGQVVVVTGEAGIGKSRLVKALTDHASARRAWFTHLQCSPYYQHTALYPLIDLLERIVLRFDREDSAQQKLSKLEGFLVETGLPLAETVSMFASLLSVPLGAEYVSPELPADQQKQQTMRALMAIPFARAAQQPVMLIVEDLHWIDPTTLEYLGMLVDDIHTAPILAVFTARPDFQPPWTDHPNVKLLDLQRLPDGAVVELTQSVAQGKSLPTQVLSEVVSKTDGVPLFIEELTKMLLESGLLEERRDHYALTGPLPPLAIPNTLQDSLMARLDRLAPVKGLAQLGAALGRQFEYELLQAVSPWDDTVLRRGLEQLVASEFLYEEGSPPRATYRFKHALVQESAYQSLLKSTRQQYHRRIAEALESEFAEIVASRPELLAHHFTEAGLPAHALPYWRSAGQRALRRGANREAASHAMKGLGLLKSLPETAEFAKHELSLQLVLGPSLSYVDGPQSVQHVYVRARELARQVGSTPELFPTLSGLAHAQIVLGHMHEARTLSEEFLELAERQEDSLTLAAAHSMCAYTAWWQGHFVEVHDHTRQCLALYDTDGHRMGAAAYNQNPAIVCGYVHALNMWMLGYPSQAVEAMERTLAYARELQHANSIGISLLMFAQLAQLRREPELARTRAEETIAISGEQGLPALELWGLLPRGWAKVQIGDVGNGIADIRTGMERRRALNIGAVWPWFYALLADAHGADGQLHEGLRLLGEALQIVERNDERLYEAEVHRIKGELLLKQDALDAAERCFAQALAVARHQQARSWQLRAAISMARQWRRQGRRDEARHLLAPVYEWFTEGFDTADLIDAKALLEEL